MLRRTLSNALSLLKPQYWQRFTQWLER
jgi:hypothetical protein